MRFIPCAFVTLWFTLCDIVTLWFTLCNIVTLWCRPRYDPALYAVSCTLKSQIQKEGESHVTRHTSHVSRHTSHVTRHTSHVPGKALITNKRSLHHALQVPSPSPKHNRKPLTASQLLTCRNASRGSPLCTSPPHATWRTSPACRVTCDV
jgi:hypothetical protein